MAFYELIGGVLEELKLHNRYAARWGVDLSNVTPSEATLAYTDFLQHAARSASVGEICAAMTPCMRLYAFLGQAVQARAHATGYTEWVETYASPAFEVCGTFQPFLEALHGYEVLRLGSNPICSGWEGNP